MKSLERRVDRLENEGGGKGRVFLALRDEGESAESAIRNAGLEPADNDTVLLLTRVWCGPGDGPTSQDGETGCRET